MPLSATICGLGRVSGRRLHAGPAWTQVILCRSRRGHGTHAAAAGSRTRPGPLQPPATGRPSEHQASGRHGRPAILLDGSVPAAETAGHLSLWPPTSRPGSGHLRTLCRVRVSVRRERWLGEPVVGSAAAGGMQPATLNANKSGGQAAAELAADTGHRRPGEQAGLLEAQVVNLQPRSLRGRASSG
jgi:hypothetical protein